MYANVAFWANAPKKKWFDGSKCPEKPMEIANGIQSEFAFKFNVARNDKNIPKS